ncbi:MAG: hypothetical protein M1833_002579 [Piccolia ochrophora]|nr:MAG: hypothetical protein M1833_002579 [Piccolia ochrophora]
MTASTSRAPVRSSRRGVGAQPSSSTTINGPNDPPLHDLKNTQNLPSTKRATRATRPLPDDAHFALPPAKRQKLDPPKPPQAKPYPRRKAARKPTSVAPRSQLPTPSIEQLSNDTQNGRSREGSTVSHPEDERLRVNGFKDVPDTKLERKRNLRSQGVAAPLKSDLSYFFPAYEEMISLDVPEPDLLDLDTPIFVIDEEPAKAAASRPVPVTPPKKEKVSSKSRVNKGTGLGSPALHIGSPFAPLGTESPKLHNAQRVDFSSVQIGARQPSSDPLDDAFYLKTHRKAERQEKQIRNIDKNRAQHEKDHLERLMEGLKGPDWLRVMGISGITESEKKIYEPKRQLVIGEVSALLEKFKAWREEEKRMKVRKDFSHAEGVLQTNGDIDIKDLGRDKRQHTEASKGKGEVEPPDYNDVDAWAARQLHQEAISAKGGRVTRSRNPTPSQAPQLPPPASPKVGQPPSPFKTFYSKPHQRTAAVGGTRKSGRTVMAFGQPLPRVREKEFKLPRSILTTDAKRASARSKRRMRRECNDTIRCA